MMTDEERLQVLATGRIGNPSRGSKARSGSALADGWKQGEAPPTSPAPLPGRVYSEQLQKVLANASLLLGHERSHRGQVARLLDELVQFEWLAHLDSLASFKARIARIFELAEAGNGR
ncbi:hypothetical protein [Desulfurivibrio sp. C05AmB]|uniref:hypothetical protein n=1 Tax=Desulfurivibrio sp. C05AmB TaxID=3374371 RepID=UPI00376F22B5